MLGSVFLGSVRIGVVTNIEAFTPDKHGLVEVLQLSLCNLCQFLNFDLPSVKLVLMSSEFLPPEPVECFGQVLIFLFESGHDRADLDLEVLVAEL